MEIEVHQFAITFPKDEIYRSVDQLRRSSSSVTNNIAEAYKKQSIREKLHSTKYSSLRKRCAKKNICDDVVANNLAPRYLECIKATQGYIRFLKEKSK